MSSPLVVLFFSLLVIQDVQSTASAVGSPQRAVYSVLLTDPRTTFGAVSGSLIYDWGNKVFAFYYPSTDYTEIYQFNNNWGYFNKSNQFVWKVSPTAQCSPCASYGNPHSFPLTNNTQWSMPTVPGGSIAANTVGSVGANGCRRYDVTATDSFISYFSLNENNGQLCAFADHDGRVWTVTAYLGSEYSKNLARPAVCKCLQPLDIGIALDRSTSIFVNSTYYYRSFMQQLVNSFYFNQSDPSITAQLGIIQWGTTLNTNQLGNLWMTQNAQNVNIAAGQIGCTSTTNCNFCAGHANGTACTDGQYTCTACGYDGLRRLFLTSNGYKVRTNAIKISIIITDGRANTVIDPVANPNNDNPRCCAGAVGDEFAITDSDQNSFCSSTYTPGGNYQVVSSSRLQGCYTDIITQRNLFLASTPNVTTFAVGVGPQIDTGTLDIIAGGDTTKRFVETNFQTLLQNVQVYVEQFCPLPDVKTECGSCCGTCNCGTCTPPDTVVPPKFCDNFTVELVGNCISKNASKIPCPPQPCKRVTCYDYPDNINGNCTYTDYVCPILNPCYNYRCFVNGTAEQCEPTTLTGAAGCLTGAPTPPTNAPTPPTNAPTPPTIAPTPPTNAPTNVPVGTPTLAPTPPTNAPSDAPTAAPTNEPCFDATGGLGCNTQNSGVCCPDGVTCCCSNGYTGILCQIPPNFQECVANNTCVQTDPCLTSYCDYQGANPTYRCIVQQVNCDDSNACTFDSCDSLLGGCLHSDESFKCNDNLGCTIDSCDPATGSCNNAPIDCSYVADICNDAYCDDFALNDSVRCLQRGKSCFRPDNCTIAECRLNYTDARLNLDGYNGCVNETFFCDFWLAGIVAAITGGAIAGIAVGAAAVVAGAMVAGSAYAVSQTTENSNERSVKSNPVYEQQTKTSVGLSG